MFFLPNKPRPLVNSTRFLKDVAGAAGTLRWRINACCLRKPPMVHPHSRFQQLDPLMMNKNHLKRITDSLFVPFICCEWESRDAEATSHNTERMSVQHAAHAWFISTHTQAADEEQGGMRRGNRRPRVRFYTHTHTHWFLKACWATNSTSVYFWSRVQPLTGGPAIGIWNQYVTNDWTGRLSFFCLM